MHLMRKISTNLHKKAVGLPHFLLVALIQPLLAAAPLSTNFNNTGQELRKLHEAQRAIDRWNPSEAREQIKTILEGGVTNNATKRIQALIEF